MHHYPFHIGDYRSSTAHLSDAEDLAYRRLIDFYMDTESCIPVETQWVARRIRVETEVLQNVLNDFFTLTENGWEHERCEAELEHYRMIQERNKINGSKGGRPKKKNPVGTQSKPTGKPTKNQEPRTKNQKFVIPTVTEVANFCKERKNSVDPEKFVDYYAAQGWVLANGNKMKDWQSAVRTWEKNDIQKKPKQEKIEWL